MTNPIEPRELTVIEPRGALVRPVASTNEIVQNFKLFQEMKNQILDKSDFQSVSGREFIKKSGWRKIAAAFGISLETVEEKRLELEDGHYGVRYTVRAIAPGGRYTDGVGLCSTDEKRFSGRNDTGHKVHDIYSTAYTRAANRAVSDLVGGGEVSYEEAAGEDNTPQLPEKLYNRLVEVVRGASFGDEWKQILNTLLIERVGRYLSADQATELGRALAAINEVIKEQKAQFQETMAQVELASVAQGAEPSDQLMEVVAGESERKRKARELLTS